MKLALLARLLVTLVRHVLGFWIAPLFVPCGLYLPFWLYDCITDARVSSLESMVFVMVPSLIWSYIIAIVVGLPALGVCTWFRLDRLKHYAAGGFLIGALPGAWLSWVILANKPQLLLAALGTIFLVSVAGLLGLFAASIFWFIARYTPGAREVIAARPAAPPRA